MGKLPNLFQSTHHSIQSRSKSSDIKRIVITSSTVAVGLTPHKGPYTEKEWNDPAVKEVDERGKEASGMAKYSVSKVRAEEGGPSIGVSFPVLISCVPAAWEVYKANASKTINWDLTTLNPPYVRHQFAIILAR